EESLSFIYRGWLISKLSKPDDWKFYTAELAKRSIKDGISAIKTALNEIEDAGYLTRKQGHKKNGQFTSQDWILTDTSTNSPQVEKPLADKAPAGKALADNRTLPNTDFKPNTDHTNKDDDDQPVESAFNLAQLAGINVNSGLNLPVFTDYIDRLVNELVWYAIRRTNDVAQHPSWSYLKTVLKSLEDHHVKPVEQAEKLSKKYGQSRKGKSTPKKSGKKQQYHFETHEAPEGMSQDEFFAKELAEIEAEDKAKEAKRDDS
ncbi:DnaD domain protein, partial [Limosilactobacillus vaginalis]|uniref:DnaD domain protein n=1 Tax=Limosilactobacillus vaginalis TaxID=1633 RepID=UPI00388CEE33